MVSLTATLEVSGEVPVSQRSGSVILSLMVERTLKYYQEGIHGVDYSDQYRERGSGFTTKAHCKRWYKKAYFTILDFIVLNSFFAWNVSTPEIKGRMKVRRKDFYPALSKEMIDYIDETGG